MSRIRFDRISAVRGHCRATKDSCPGTPAFLGGGRVRFLKARLVGGDLGTECARSPWESSRPELDYVCRNCIFSDEDP